MIATQLEFWRELRKISRTDNILTSIQKKLSRKQGTYCECCEIKVNPDEPYQEINNHIICEDCLGRGIVPKGWLE